MTAHPLAGTFSVEASARLIRNYRYVEERMMRMLGGWIALTPEVPVKLLFGRHVWDCAQHADAWGKRLPELRAPAQQSEPANERVVAFMDTIQDCEGPETTPERVTGVYRVLKPHLAAVYARHLADANAIYEPPTRRILQRCLDEERRHVAAGAIVIARLGGGAEWRRRAERWEQRLLDAVKAAGGVTGSERSVERDFTAPPAETLESSPWYPARDVVAVGSAFDHSVVPEDLADRVNAHCRALQANDLAGALEVAVPDARPGLEALYAAVRGPLERWRIVACARVGTFRLVKLALEGADRRAVVQMQWRPVDGTWRLAAADVIGASGR